MTHSSPAHPSTTHLAGRTALQLLAVLTMLAALLAPMLIGTPAWADHSNDPGTASGYITFEYDGGTHTVNFDEDTLGADVSLPGYEWDESSSGMFHLSCSETLLDTTATVVEVEADEEPSPFPLGVTATIVDFHTLRINNGGHEQECSAEIQPDPATLSVSKVVALGENADGPAGPFGFSVDCGDSRTADFTLNDGESWDAPEGWLLIVSDSCTVTETDTQDADSTTAEWNEEAHTLGTLTQLTVADNDVVVTNTYNAVVIETNPAISLEKTAVTSDGLETDDGTPLVLFDSDDETVTYTFVVTNTGDVTLTDVVIDDPMLSDGVIPVADSLAAGESETVDVVYTVTEADLEAGTLTNLATAIGNDGDDEVTDEDDALVEIAAVEDVVIEKPDPKPAPDVESEELAQTGLDAPWLAVLSALFLALGTALLRRTAPLTRTVRRFGS